MGSRISGCAAGGQSEVWGAGAGGELLDGAGERAEDPELQAAADELVALAVNWLLERRNNRTFYDVDGVVSAVSIRPGIGWSCTIRTRAARGRSSGWGAVVVCAGSDEDV